MPEERRSLNLVELDAAASPAEVAAELATGGLFGGGKVVIVAEPAFLQSKEDLAGAFARASDMWREGRQREAARRLVALAARFGWSTADLCGESPPPVDEWERKLQPDDGLRARGRRLPARRRPLRRGEEPPGREGRRLRPRGASRARSTARVRPGDHGREGRRSTAAGEAAGRGGVPHHARREERGNLGCQAAGPRADARGMLAGTGKSVDPGAEDRLAALVGTDARALAAEVAKLAAFVGDRRRLASPTWTRWWRAPPPTPSSRSATPSRPATSPGRSVSCAGASPTAPAPTCGWARWPAPSGGCWSSRNGDAWHPAESGSPPSATGAPRSFPPSMPRRWGSASPTGSG